MNKKFIDGIKNEERKISLRKAINKYNKINQLVMLGMKINLMSMIIIMIFFRKLPILKINIKKYLKKN